MIQDGQEPISLAIHSHGEDSVTGSGALYIGCAAILLLVLYCMRYFRVADAPPRRCRERSLRIEGPGCRARIH